MHHHANKLKSIKTLTEMRENHSHLIWVIRGPHDVERAPARQHLVEQHPQGPPVHGEGIIFAAEDLWSDVVGGPAEGRRCVALKGRGRKGVLEIIANSSVGFLFLHLLYQNNSGPNLAQRLDI